MSGRELRAPKGSVVPSAKVRSYYDRPIVKAPVWTWEIPSYAFAGGLAGASATLAAAAEVTGHPEVARASRWAAAAGTLVSPVLLISDLGRPDRFHHMLRVVRPTSPMNVGTWLLSSFGPPAVAAAALAELGRFGRLQRVSSAVAAGLGPAMATYTAVLFSNTAIPIWHEGGTELPLVFAGSSAASAGALAAVAVNPTRAGAARRLTVAGAVVELSAHAVMERRLGWLAEPYRTGRPGRFARWARGLTVAGAAAIGLGGRRSQVAAMAGGVLVLAGSVCERWAVFTAGSASAADPRYVVGPQRDRMAVRGEEPGSPV